MDEALAYYSLPRTLLTLIGHWPYQNTRFIILKNSLISFSLFLFIVAQCMVFLTREFMLKYVSFVLVSVGYFAKYNINWYLLPTAKKFMDKIKRDIEMEHGEALQIMKNNAYMAKVNGIRFGSVFYLSLLYSVVYYTTMYVYEKISPINGTRLKNFPISTDYLILEEKYDFLVFLHINISLTILVTIIVGTETLMILWLKHAASLSDVASYYVRKTIFTNSKYQCDDRTRRDIAKAVIAHTRALEYIKELPDINALAYAILLLFAIASLAINLFRLSASYSDLFSSEFEEPVASILLVVCELMYMYYLNYLCEQSYEYHNNFSIGIFHDNWYETTVTTQKLLLNMMLRTSETFSFNVYSFYTATVENFSTLVKTSVSYFMMITSMQQ